MLEKYAHLLVNYCLELKSGEKLFIQTTTLAEPLLREVYRAAIKKGVHVEYQMTFREQNRIFINEAQDHQLDYVSPSSKTMMETFDAYLVIRAPFNVRVEREGALALVTLAWPERLNALTPEMMEQLADTTAALQQDCGGRAVLLRGEGRGFCSGADVGTTKGLGVRSGRQRIQRAHRVIAGLANMDKPVIAAVRGAAVGVGWSLALACDLILASENASFSLVFKKIGLAPDGAAAYFLTQYIGVLRARELMMSARRVPAAEACALGMVNEVLADDQLDARALLLKIDNVLFWS